MRHYAKPIVVPDSLAALRGSATGPVTLPRHLDWTGPGVYDLGEPARLVDFYRTVLIEATKPADLHTYLNRETLVGLWRSLWLPATLRSAWEQKFPELRPAASGATAA